MLSLTRPALKSMYDFLIGLFLPYFCVGCGSYGTMICRRCQLKIVTIPQRKCFYCKQVNFSGQTCNDCRRQVVPLDQVIALIDFGNQWGRQLIHHYKYKGGRMLLNGLSEVILQIKNLTPRAPNTLITFVPADDRRIKSRPYNSAEEIAKFFGQLLNIPVIGLLRKTRSTASQSTLSKLARHKNLMNAFGVHKLKNHLCRGAQIIICDDVITTGTTVEECAKVLKQAGAQKITALALAQKNDRF